MVGIDGTGLLDENGNFLPQNLNNAPKITGKSFGNERQNTISVQNILKNYYSNHPKKKLSSSTFSNTIGKSLEKKTQSIDNFFGRFYKLSSKLHTADDKAMYVMARLQDELKLTRAQAAGVAGNIWEESKFNPKAVGDKGSAHGIVQWHPNRRKNVNILNIPFEDQVTYMIEELKGDEKYALSMLRRTQTPQDAAAVVDKLYERSDGKSLQSRKDQAYRYFNLLK